MLTRPAWLRGVSGHVASTSRVEAPVIMSSLLDALDQLGQGQQHGSSNSRHIAPREPERDSNQTVRANTSRRYNVASGSSPQRDFSTSATSTARKGAQTSRSKLTPLLDAGNTEPPQWSQWSLDDLQSEAKRWGFRSSLQRPDLMQKLDSVWTALLDLRQTVAPGPLRDDQRSRVASQAYPSPEKSDVSVADDTADQSTNIASSRRLLELLQGDAQLHQRILLMEPIPFEEVWSLVQRARIYEDGPMQRRPRKIQEEVKTWLDLRGVVWYDEVRTSRQGPRR